MRHMKYHLLAEGDNFSVYRGNAVAKNVATVMRLDDSTAVVSPYSDDSWGFGPDRILEIPQLRVYDRIRGRKRLPTWVTGAYFRHIYRPLLSRLKEGDIVWCHNQPHVSAALAVPLRARGAKLVFHFHDLWNVQMAQAAFKSFVPDACVFVSDALRQHVLKLLPWLRNTFIIHNGADPLKFYPPPPGTAHNNPAPVILYVGRLHPEKGVHVLLDAMRILQKRKVNALCNVVGPSCSRSSRPTRYDKKLLDTCPSNVQFRGRTLSEEIGEVYRAADISCCPSICEEGFGNVNIEAMACGVPVVATRVGGIPEIAAQGGVALVEPNSPTKLADGLERFIEDKELRVRTGNQGLQSFQRRFTWDVFMKKYRDVSDTLTQSKSEAIAGPV